MIYGLVKLMSPSTTREVTKVAERPLNQVATTPYLLKSEPKCWVTFEGHINWLHWKLPKLTRINDKLKRLCERVSAEAALMKEQTEVQIT